MRVALISDVHGNLVALETVFTAIAKECIGDGGWAYPCADVATL